MLGDKKRGRISESSSIESEPEITIDFPSSASASINSESRKISKLDLFGKKEIPTKNGLSNRRKSSVEKTEELQTVKVEALNQLENTIKMADVIKANKQTILRLQMETKTLKEDLKLSQQKLLESRGINRDLMDRLQSLDNINARQKIDLENIRTEGLVHQILDSPVSTDTSYSRYLKDMYENRDQLLRENGELVQTVEELTKQVKSKQSVIELLERERRVDFVYDKDIDESTVEHRSKGNLLKVIRGHMDDKMVWMEYGIKLTQEALQHCPAIFDIGPDTQRGAPSDQDCRNEHCRWAKLAVTVLKRLSRSSPQDLREIVKSADADQIRFIESTSK